MNGAVIVTAFRSGSTKSLAPGAELLDDGEQVVPASRVQARAVVAQLVEDLFHLERRGDRLDQRRGPDRAVRDAEEVLGDVERVVPQPRLEVRTPSWAGRSTGPLPLSSWRCAQAAM